MKKSGLFLLALFFGMSASLHAYAHSRKGIGYENAKSILDEPILWVIIVIIAVSIMGYVGYRIKNKKTPD